MSDQQTLPKDVNTYLMFPKGTDPDVARARFRERFGCDPEREFTMWGALEDWWLGPVPKEPQQ